MEDTYTNKLKRHPLISHNKSTSYTGPQIAQIYNFPSPSQSNPITVGIISFGGGMYGSIDSNGILTNGDVQSTWITQGISASNIPKVIVKFINGATNDLADSGSTVENTLDVSAIGACCPNSNLTIILFIFPQTVTWSFAFNTVISGITISGISYKPKIISVSWGSSEIDMINANATSTFINVNTILQNATNNGINICCSTGDYGSTNESSRLDVVFPASCPYVTAVGGTTLNCPTYDYSDVSTTEVVWNNGIVNGKLIATGGGVSRYYGKPMYQNGLSGVKRLIPDISLLGDPNTGFSFKLNGSNVVIGGTSLSAPVFAAYLACIETLKFFVNPILYSNQTAFYDITSGNNYDPYETDMSLQNYSATTGYDCCSGLGSINGTILTPIIKNYLLTPLLSITSPINKTTNDISFNIGQYIITNSTRSFTFSSSDTSVATVDTNSGIVTIVGTGTTTITVNLAANATYDSATRSIIIQVRKVTPTLTVTSPINKTTNDISFNIGQYIITNSTRSFTFSSSDTSVATVDTNSGIVTIVGAGTTTITVNLAANTTYDSATVIIRINVNLLCSSIKITGINNTVYKKNNNITVTLRTIITPLNATNKVVKWSSNNNSIASINRNGTLTIKKIGRVTITSVTTDGSNLSDSITITIKKK